MATFNISVFSNVNDTNSTINNSQNNIDYIIQIPPFTLIIIFASIYIVLVLSRKTFRIKKMNWLAVNICFSSVILAVIELLTIISRLSNISQTVILCRLRGFIINVGVCHVMYSHCLAAFCRLLSIRYHHKPLFRSTRWLLGNIILNEIIVILIPLPSLFYDGFTCPTNYGASFLKIYTAISTIFIPIAIVFGCNIAIYRYARKSSQRVQNTNNNNANQLSNRDMYLCKILLLTFCVFFTGWALLFVEQVLISQQIQLAAGLVTFFQILPPICLLADVLLLIYSDQPVRKLLLKVLTCHGKIPC